MVQVRESHKFNPDGSICFEEWLVTLQLRGTLDHHERIRRACELSWDAEQRARATNTVSTAKR